MARWSPRSHAVAKASTVRFSGGMCRAPTTMPPSSATAAEAASGAKRFGLAIT